MGGGLSLDHKMPPFDPHDERRTSVAVDGGFAGRHARIYPNLMFLAQPARAQRAMAHGLA
jgi:hypothetical protein